jgi:hypothetical protein
VTGQELTVAARCRWGVGGLLLIACAALALRLSFLLGGGGPLAFPTDYDDGVYFSASALLVRSVLPYRDFVFVHPPGIAWFHAVISWWHDPAVAFATARVLTGVAGALNTFLAGAIVLRAGSRFGALIAAALYASFPEAVNAERSTYLEPILNLGCLTAAFIWLSPGQGGGQRPFSSGLLAGFACAVKLLGGIWVVAALLSPPPGRAAAAAFRFLAGGVIAGAVLLLPLALMAPAEFLSQVLVFQLQRPPDGTTDALSRLPMLLGGGHLAATILAAAAMVAMAGRAIREGVTSISRTERFFAAATLLTLVAFLASSSYWPHYNAYLAASLSVLGGLGAAALLRAGGGTRAMAAAISLLVAALLVTPVREAFEAALQRNADAVALRRAAADSLPETAALFAFDPSWGLLLGRLPAHSDGAPVIVDSYGAMLLAAMRSDESFADTNEAFRRAAEQPEVRERLENSRFVITGWRGSWQLPERERSWLAANFICVTPEAGLLCLRQRVGALSSMDAVTFDRGWYDEESLPPHTWRWMGKRGSVTLPPIAAPARIYLEFDFPEEGLGGAPVITLTLDERLLERADGSAGELIRIYDVEGSAAPRELAIETDRTFVPAFAGESDDRRELGLRLKRIIWISVDGWSRLQLQENVRNDGAGAATSSLR